MGLVLELGKHEISNAHVIFVLSGRVPKAITKFSLFFRVEMLLLLNISVGIYLVREKYSKNHTQDVEEGRIFSC